MTWSCKEPIISWLTWKRSSQVGALTTSNIGIDWLIDWSTIVWLIDWLIEFIGRTHRWNWLTDWLIDWLIDWLADWLTDWLNWLIGWFIGSLIGFTKRHAVFLYCKLFLPKPPVIQWRTWSETTSESQYSLLNQYGHSRTGVIKLAYSITQFSSYDSFHSFSMSKSMNWGKVSSSAFECCPFQFVLCRNVNWGSNFEISLNLLIFMFIALYLRRPLLPFAFSSRIGTHARCCLRS